MPSEHDPEFSALTHRSVLRTQSLIGPLIALLPLIAVVHSEPLFADALASGLFHSCVATDALGAKCWGRNSSGELGDGTTVYASSPVGVAGFSGSVVKVVAGNAFTCAM